MPMEWRRGWAGMAVMAVAVMGPAIPRGRAAAPPSKTWNAAGTLVEACTCAVPCSCNFGEAPSPHSYCYSVFGYRLDKAAWDGIDLSGLTVAGADGPRGGDGYLDERATPAQRPALRAMAEALFAQGGPSTGPRTWTFARLTPTTGSGRIGLRVGERGGFMAQTILGRDGKTPVIVENNTVWPIRRSAKGKTGTLRYDGPRGNAVHGTGTSANEGAFYFTSEVTRVNQAARVSKGGASCCQTAAEPPASGQAG